MSSKNPVDGPFLALDLGNFYTRAFLFDRSGAQYRLAGQGKSTTTLGAIGGDINFGVRMALEDLQAVTGRDILDAHKNLIQPVNRDGRGVNHCVLSISAGPPFKIFITGLIKDASTRTAQQMARFAGARETIIHDLENDSTPDQLIDRLLDALPDLILIACGANERTFQKVIKRIDVIYLAMLQLPPEERPEIICLCNPSWQRRIQSLFGREISLRFVPNSINPGFQDISVPWVIEIGQANIAARVKQIPGLAGLAKWAIAGVWLSPVAFSHLIQLLGQFTSKDKGVIGIDIGVADTQLSVAYAGRIFSETISDKEIYTGMVPVASDQFFEIAKRWSGAAKISDERFQEFIANKMLFPGSKTLTTEDQSIQISLARLSVRDLKEHALPEFPAEIRTQAGLITRVEPILISGENLSEATSPGQACMVILDGLQPTGITTLILDHQHLAAPLGALAGLDHQIVEQVMNSSVFVHLATVISLVGRATPGTPVLRVKAIFDDGHVSIMDVKQGDLEAIPLAPGHFAEIQLQPFHRYDIGMGEPGMGGVLKANGSLLGVVIDARGRPIQLSEDTQRRSEQFRKWLWMLGG